MDKNLLAVIPLRVTVFGSQAHFGVGLHIWIYSLKHRPVLFQKVRSLITAAPEIAIWCIIGTLTLKIFPGFTIFTFSVLRKRHRAELFRLRFRLRKTMLELDFPVKTIQHCVRHNHATKHTTVVKFVLTSALTYYSFFIFRVDTRRFIFDTFSTSIAINRHSACPIHSSLRLKS